MIGDSDSGEFKAYGAVNEPELQTKMNIATKEAKNQLKRLSKDSNKQKIVGKQIAKLSHATQVPHNSQGRQRLRVWLAVPAV